LAKYRRKPITPSAGVVMPAPESSPSTAAEPEYVAFDAQDNAVRLRIYSTMAPAQSPRYNLLLNVAFDGDYGTNFVLTFTMMMVLVRGRNLQKLIFAIENDMAVFIQEFDPDRWDKPTDPTAAFIESIQILAGGIPSDEKKH
jgi:hypothetical protein